MKHLKYASVLAKAEKLMSGNKLDLALTEYGGVLKKDPKNFIAHANCAIIYSTLNENKKAIEHFEIIKDKLPSNERLLLKYAECLSKTENYDEVIEELENALSAHNKNCAYLCAIAAAYSKKEKHTEALSYALQAIEIDPKNPNAFLQLGNVLFDLKRFDDAIIAFNTVTDLEPNNPTAKFNLGSCYTAVSKYDESIQEFEECLQTPDLTVSSIKQIKFFLSHTYLKKGELQKGWELHEHGFINNTQTSRHPNRKFNVPQWNGQAIHGKRLLIWKEQGLGDMFMFMSCFPQVLQLCDDIIIECDYRTTSLIKRSFPQCNVRHESYFGDFTSEHQDFDLHLPMGSLMYHFRPDLKSFAQSKPYLLPNPDLVRLFSDRLSDNERRLKIGVCWRSGVTSTFRNSNYLPLAEFLPVLSIPNCTFVNLQYGDCSKELAILANDYGILLNNWPDIDQKNNIEAVASLISELDLVISAGTAVAQIAAAVGTKLFLFAPRNSYTLLGQDEYPWYPNIKTFLFTSEEEKAEIPSRIQHYITENFESLKRLT